MRTSLLLPSPLSERRGIPFYHAKTEEEFRSDVYERYDELVTRQVALHLADELHGGYPFQDMLDYILKWLPEKKDSSVADLGCSVGRLAAEMAAYDNSWQVYGVDLSYQMLRQARDFWVLGETVQPNLVRYGFGSPSLTGYRRDNLQFALAKAEALPFPDASLDLIVNTFLIDRLPSLSTAFAEWRRVLKPGGRLVVVSPLNFLEPGSWRKYYPPIKLFQLLNQSGWIVENWTDSMTLKEPMDARGNSVHWQCLAFVMQR